MNLVFEMNTDWLLDTTVFVDDVPQSAGRIVGHAFGALILYPRRTLLSRSE